MMRKTLIKKYFWLTAVLCIAIVGSVWAGLGEVAFEKWNGIGGVLVTDLTTLPAFPDSPDETGFMPDFKTGWNLDDNYGARLWAYVMPPATGDYTFWIYADDYAELLLSPTINREDAQVIAQVNGWTSEAQWDKYSEQQSVPISLQGGRPYYMEAIWKEGGGGDGCGVGWGGPVIGAGPVIIAGQYCSTLVPNITINPTPADGATLVPIDTDLSWEGPTLIPNASFEIYIGTDPNTDFGTKYTVGEGVTTFDLPADLAYGTTYHWRVDSVDPNDGNPVTYKGIEWSFTTSPLYPVVTTQPQQQRVFPGETAQFSINIYLDPAAPTDVTYQWKKEDPNTGDSTVLTDGGDISGATTDTLSVANAEPADEAVYYCVVSNSNGSDESEKAPMIVNRVLAWYKFNDGSGTVAADSSGNGFNATVAGAIWLGDALDFARDASTYVEVPADVFAGVDTQMSVSLWENGDPDVLPTSTSCFWGENAAHQRAFQVHLPWSNSNIYLDAGNVAGAYDRINRSFQKADFAGEWNHWTFVKNADTGLMEMYHNGELVLQGTDRNRAIEKITRFVIGAGIDGTGALVNFWDGQIKDFKIYNYARSGLEIAREWTSQFGGEICVGGNPEMDLNGDCIVNLEDFAIFAINWMECNRFPADACN